MPNQGAGGRFEEAIRQIDTANSEDPKRIVFEGREYPSELLYSERMTAWLRRLDPNPSEALQLAARAQHIGRWTIPRDTYPMDRDGYHRWRSDLARFHSEMTAAILTECGYEEGFIQRVSALIRKERFKADPEAQTLEDVACLVFLEYYFHDFAAEHEAEKVIAILARSWKKMSERGHQAALTIPFRPEERALIERALS